MVGGVHGRVHHWEYTMPSPLQQRSYELIVRAGSIPVKQPLDPRVQLLLERLFRNAIDLGAELECALGGMDREMFQYHTYELNMLIRQVKLWIRLLDDLGEIEPEVAQPLHAIAEEVHALVLAALRTLKAERN